MLQGGLTVHFERDEAIVNLCLIVSILLSFFHVINLWCPLVSNLSHAGLPLGQGGYVNLESSGLPRGVLPGGQPLGNLGGPMYPQANPGSFSLQLEQTMWRDVVSLSAVLSCRILRV